MKDFVTFHFGLYHWPPDVKKVAYFNQVISLDCLARGNERQHKPNCYRALLARKEKGERLRDDSWGQKARKSSSYVRQGDPVEIKVTNIEHLTSTFAIV